MSLIPSGPPSNEAKKICRNGKGFSKSSKLFCILKFTYLVALWNPDWCFVAKRERLVLSDQPDAGVLSKNGNELIREYLEERRGSVGRIEEL